jgi:hypothetical protein
MYTKLIILGLIIGAPLFSIATHQTLSAREERGQRNNFQGREGHRGERNFGDRGEWNRHNYGEVNVNPNSGNSGTTEVIMPPMDSTQQSGGQDGGQ